MTQPGLSMRLAKEGEHFRQEVFLQDEQSPSRGQIEGLGYIRQSLVDSFPLVLVSCILTFDPQEQYS